MNLAATTVVHRLDATEQVAWLKQVRAVAAVCPFARPVMPQGQPLRVRVTSAGDVGWWSSRERGYHYAETDSRGRRWPPIPAEWSALADAVAGSHPWDTALVNWYAPDASLGWHVDDSERQRDLPIVTVSLGDACTWGVRDRDGAAHWTRLESGDVTLLAEPTRGLAHSVGRIEAAPLLSPLGTTRGRVSVTIRCAR